MNERYLKFLKNPFLILDRATRFINNDKLGVYIQYFCYHHKILNLKNPQTYNEKLQWMKLYNRNPLYTQLVDKIEVKKYVDNILGPGHTFPLLGVWDNPEDIDFNSLPNQYVLKCNHNSANGMAICWDNEGGKFSKAHGGDKILINKDQVIERLKKGLAQDYSKGCREWAYKNVKRRVFAEQFMKSDDGEPLKDYKILCFDGEPRYIWVGSNYDPMWFDIYSTDWENMHVKWGYEIGPEKLPSPEKLEEMLDIARKLSQGIPHVRVDLYSIGGIIYFGEFTFYTWAGLVKFEPEEWDLKLGELIRLPKSPIH